MLSLLLVFRNCARQGIIGASSSSWSLSLLSSLVVEHFFSSFSALSRSMGFNNLEAVAGEASLFTIGEISIFTAAGTISTGGVGDPEFGLFFDNRKTINFEKKSIFPSN